MINEQDHDNAVGRLQIIANNLNESDEVGKEFSQIMGVEIDIYMSIVEVLTIIALVGAPPNRLISQAFAMGVLCERERQRREGDFL